MNDSQQLREQIWDFIYGLLSDDESRALIARVKSDPAAARLYAEVQLQSELVGRAARVEDAALVLNRSGADALAPVPATKSNNVAAVRRQSRAGAVIRLANWAAAVALAGLLAVGFWWPTKAARRLALAPLAIDVLAARSLPAGLTTHVTLQTYRLSGSDNQDEPAAAAATLRLVDRDGRERLRRVVQTDANGQAVVELPGESLEPGVQLVVENAQSTTPELGRAEAALHSRQSPEQTSAIVAALPVQAEPVMAYFLLAEPTVEPGKDVPFSAWNVTAFSNKPAAAEYAQAAIESVDGGAVAQSPVSNAPQPGLVNGVVQLPADAPAGPLTLQLSEPPADARAAGLARAGGSQPARGVRLQSPSYASNRAVPNEPAGVVRQRAQLAAGPVRELADKTEADQKELAKQTGLAKKALADSYGTQKADEGQAAASSLPIIAAGQPVKVSVPAELAGKPLMAAVVCRGVTVATATADAPPASQLAAPGGRGIAASDMLTLDIPPEADGLIDVELYDRSASEPQLASRSTIYREPQRKLRIELPVTPEHFKPGESVNLKFQVLDERGQPAADTRLGVRVWNEQLVEQSDEQPVLLADAVRNVPNDVVREAVQQQSIAAAPAIEDRSARRGGPLPAAENQVAVAPPSTTDSQPVELTSNRALVLSAIHESIAQNAERRQYLLNWLGMAALVSGGLVLIALAASFAARLALDARHFAPTAALAVASLLVGLWWIRSEPSATKSQVALANTESPAATNAVPAASMPAAQDEAVKESAARRREAPAAASAERLAADDVAAKVAAPIGGFGGGQPAKGAASTPLATAPTSPPPDRETNRGSIPLADQSGRVSLPSSSQVLRRREAVAPSSPLAGGAAGRPNLAAAPAMPSLNSIARPLPPARAAAAGQPSEPPAAAATLAAAPAAAPAEHLASASAPAALYFNPQLLTDAEGRATVQFTMPRVNSKYRVLIDALGQGRIGSRQETIICTDDAAK